MSRVWKLALLGDPVAHSLSPVLQLAALEAAGLEGSYELIRCPAGQLAARLERLAGEGFQGLNLTLPLKEEGFALSERLSAEARRLGAVNTLRRIPEGWEGHNTDLEGFRRAVQRHFGSPLGCRVLLFGAGGAARAVLAGLMDDEIAQVLLWNRSPERAARLLDGLEGSRERTRLVLRDEELASALEVAELIIQATSLGLDPGDPLPPLPPIGRAPHVMDLVTHETPWLAACSRLGCKIADGRSMLLEQGAAAFHYWTGLPASRQAMERAIGLS